MIGIPTLEDFKAIEEELTIVKGQLAQLIKNLDAMNIEERLKKIEKK